MNIGFLGLGKLGLPVYREEWVDKYLPNTKLEINDIDQLVKNSEIIFVPIQTPHDPQYEGVTRIPEKRIDFDYSYLKSGIKDLSEAIEKNNEDKVVIIISTVLPGTIRNEINPCWANTLSFVIILFL